MSNIVKKTSVLKIDNSGFETLSNDSDNTEFATIMAKRHARRQVLKGGLGFAISAFFLGALNGCGEGASGPVQGTARKTPLLGFTPVAASREDRVVIPRGYRASVFSAWGDPLNGTEPAYRPMPVTQPKSRHDKKARTTDGMHFFPIDSPTGGENSAEGLLVTNHEYVDPNILHKDGPILEGGRPVEQVYKEMAAHGISIQHIKKQPDGQWQVVADSHYNRRITASTIIELAGPVRGYEKCRTAFSPDGTLTRGTLNNCSNGVTPWNTYLAAEENWAGYFVNHDPQPVREHRRYGVGTKTSRYHWEKADTDNTLCRRFDASSRAEKPELDFRNEPNTFGWMVEIDPFDPDARPRKRTALGRFAHEGVIFAPVREGEPIVCYSGDDARFEYIYKFVSKHPYYAQTAGGHLLDEGTLYVARFNEDGTGDWLPLDYHDPGFISQARSAGVTFTSQEDVLVNTRLAADVAGATKMDRPEWGAVHPQTGEVYFTLTNNTERKADQVDSANPRAANANGHIIRWRELSPYGGASRFEWDILVLAGDIGTTTGNNGSDTMTHPPIELSADNHFASPDGLWFDPRGVLWIQTDMSGSQRNDGPFGNNQMLAADPVTGDIRRFLVGPVECEVTGITATPDLKTLFVNIQHPGEYSEPGQFTSHWPDGAGSRPRSATLVIERDDGGIIGT